MSQNQQIKDLAEKGLRTQDLLDDRPDPTDGWMFWNGNELINNNWGLVFARTAAGDYSIAAVGAATWRAIASLSPFARIRTAKGLKITDVAFHYNISNVAATSVDLLIQKATYADAAVPTVTNLTFSYGSVTDTNAKRVAIGNHLLIATLSVPEFQETDLSWYSAELTVVIPGGGATLNVRGAGMHYTHDQL